MKPLHGRESSHLEDQRQDQETIAGAGTVSRRRLSLEEEEMAS